MNTAMKGLTSAIVCTALALHGSLLLAGTFVAYSLKSAQQRLTKSAQSASKVQTLGGITRIAGMVYDPAAQDLILVGEVQGGGQTATLDELVVALRALLVHEKWPAVSIDRTSDTERTGRQAVRFVGNLEHTRFGRYFLDADITLKKLALGTVRTLSIPSYFSLALEDNKKNGLGDDINTRFWFYAVKPAVAARDDVFGIKHLTIGVRTQVMSAVIDGRRVDDVRGVRDEVGEVFAAELTVNQEDLAGEFPEISRLKILFDLVAVAKGLQSLKSKYDLRYWLEEYMVGSVETPETYPVLSRSEETQVGHTAYHMEVNGGVQLQALLIRLKDGDVTALRDAVLKSRPAGDSLTWTVPLPGWHIPGTSETDAEVDADLEEVLGDQFSCTVNRHITATGVGAPVASFPSTPFSGAAPEFSVTDRLTPQYTSTNIGGVMLSGAATVDGTEEARVNITQGNFSLVVDGKNACIAPEAYRKFVTALWCVYYSGQDPGISIDPPWGNSEEEQDPEKWTDDEKHSVRYIGRVLNTDLGRVMREADYLMKKWAVGTEQPNYPGFFSVDRYAATLGVEPKGVPTRFWFVPKALSFKRGGELLLFDGGRMELNTEYDRDGLRGKASAADEQFADFFTRHYNAIAARNAVYQELLEYAKLVSLAKYLKQQGVPLHWFLMANKDLVLLEDSPQEVNGLLNHSDYVQGLVVKGGVDLAAKPSYTYDAQAAAAVENMISPIPAIGGHVTGLAGAGRDVRHVPCRFSFDVGQQSYSVIPQHTLTSGKDHRGIRYQTDLALRQDGRPGLELVRYFSPRDGEGGEFGRGWHLLIPYRVSAVDGARREFLNALIPQRMEVENLCTGQREVLSFSEDRYSAAGYVPDQLESSQVVGLFLMSDASYRLADKLGNQFHFDQAGYLTDMFLSPSGDHHVHIEYADDFTAAFTKTPYAVRPVGNEKVAFLNAMVPKQVKVTDLVNGDSELLSFDDANPIPGYRPSDEKGSRYRLLAILSNAGLQLVDKHGNQNVFDPAWKFLRMLPSSEHRLVRSITMGGQMVTFGYTINSTGEAIIASSSVSAGTPGAPVTHVVRYEHDKEGRLCRVEHTDAAELQRYSRRDNDWMLASK